ncbi:MAG TPA: helix-turn-helix domain-containing protein [Candidatus Dormibacteraeota bacterium]|nr:helix-turn-helix domain-containing protein [Candidatus Dormibacteraeota bacterium]
MTVPTWLSLDEAAKRLSVHPATLREWADKGQIRTFRTPGGHRRFSETDVAKLGAHVKPDLSLLMHATVGHARIATSGGRLSSESWYARFDEVAKVRQRELGMQLVQLLVSFLSDGERDWTTEIKQLGARYAELARDAGLSRGDAMRAFHLFEGIVRSSASELGAAKVARADLEENVGWFLNEVRVAMVEAFS